MEEFSNEDYVLSDSIFSMWTNFYNRENTLGKAVSFPFLLVFVILAYPIALIADIIVYFVYPRSVEWRSKYQFALLIAVVISIPVITYLYNAALSKSIMAEMMGGKRRKH
jgi:hypothetical protein